ncbi:MAG: hypothetical protein KKB30_07170 [Proteobacteria bacterium]|nr:hypothetical protein [Pseudomonadota bacterium]MBU1714211.1 hypothetical protein [Pseudomonadota bacterium]
MKPLGKVKQLVENIGMGISYAYEDLIFLEHNAFLLQFGQNGRSLIVHINEEASQTEITDSIGKLEDEAPRQGLTISRGEFYKLCPGENDETIILEFHD